MWNFTSKLRRLVVLHKGLDSYNLPPFKDVEARKALCKKLTNKIFPFVWATLMVSSIVEGISQPWHSLAPSQRIESQVPWQRVDRMVDSRAMELSTHIMGNLIRPMGETLNLVARPRMSTYHIFLGKRPGYREHNNLIACV